MINQTTSAIKRAQKESLFLREISHLFLKASMDDKRLQGLHVNRVTLSPDKGWCSVYFYSPEGKAFFEEALPTLVLYKPSLRQALAQKIRGRYVPELVFKYDDQYEKQLQLEHLFEKIKEEDAHLMDEADQ